MKEFIQKIRKFFSSKSVQNPEPFIPMPTKCCGTCKLRQGSPQKTLAKCSITFVDVENIYEPCEFFVERDAE